MDNNFEGWGIDELCKKQYSEFDKILLKRAISWKKNEYTRLKNSLTLVELLDVPQELVKNVDFITENKIGITFYESVEFCVEKYFKTNSDLIQNKKLTIKYLDKEGFAVRTDEYEISKLDYIVKESLNQDGVDLTVKIILDCKSHDISTCKE